MKIDEEKTKLENQKKVLDIEKQSLIKKHSIIEKEI